jgi:uncharacterized protein (DUF1697 family)
MTTRVAFLRAVNVGKRTVKMARLVEIFEELGYTDVWTYINSGNVVFDASGSRAAIEQAVEQALEAEYGFEVTTFVRTANEITKILAAAPFTAAGNDTHFVTFLKAAPPAGATKEFEALSNEFDTLVVQGRDVHWLMHGKSTETTVKQKQWKLIGELSTSRNTTMLRKLLAKIEERGSAAR